MSSMQRGPWWRRPLAVIAALSMTGGALAVTAPAASATVPAPIAATSGSLDWGVKQSFRSYLASPIAKGTATPGNGASVNGDGTFKFPAATVDPVNQVLSFGGSVSFTGHDGALAVNVSDIRLDLGRGFLVADVASKSLSGAEMMMFDDVDLTSLSAGGSIADGAANGIGLATAVTAAGAPAFAAFYESGVAFDPVTFAATYAVPVAVPVVSVAPVSASVETGNAVSFSADATGYESIQWQVSAAGNSGFVDVPGAVASTLTFIPSITDNGRKYRAVFTNAGGQAITEPAILTVTEPVVVAAPQVTSSPVAVSAKAGAEVSFEAAATGHTSVQWQVSANGSDWTELAGQNGTTLNFTAATADNGNKYRAAFTNQGGTVFTEAATLSVGEVETPAPVFSPELELFAADGVTPLTGVVAEGSKVVVKGSGFDPVGNVAPEGSRPPIAGGSPAGTYVVFGKFADQWRPSLGAPSSARVVGDQRWALSQDAFDAIAPMFQSAVRGQWVEVSPEGEFTAELTVQKKVTAGAEVQWPEAGNFGVYSYAAGGTVNADQELYAPITVGEVEVPADAPTLTVKPATGLKHGSTVTVSGSGYAANRWIYLAEVAQGPGGSSRPDVYENAARVQAKADGTFGPIDFSVTTIFKNGGFNAVDNTLYLATFNSPLETDNEDPNDRSQDAFVKLEWADPSAPVITEPETPLPEMPVLVLGSTTVEAGKAVSLSGSNFTPGSQLQFTLDGEAIDVGAAATTEVTGSLNWGVKESFRNYLNSNVAKGVITAGGGATVNADGTFNFPAKSFDPTGKVADYAGTISMVGHADALQIKLSNIRVDIKAGKLFADVTSKSLEGKSTDYPGVALVDIDTTAVTSDATSLVGKKLPTVLAGTGAPAFASFYEAGETFDALSFEIKGTAAAAPTVVGSDGSFTGQWSVPAQHETGSFTLKATATAPQKARTLVSTGVETASAKLEITAPKNTVPLTPIGPSTPVITGDKDADTNQTGTTCTNGKIVAGTLKWGVKESFRKYITGNIAKGTITFNGVQVGADQVFTFTAGTGAIDYAKRTGEVKFAGTVAFQGHDYGSGAVLSVTMDNVTLVLDGKNGSLKADVVSRSLESATEGSAPGPDVRYDSVVLASLDLSSTELNKDETNYLGKGIAATLAPTGVAPFADFYAAGDALDPLSFALGCAAGDLPDLGGAGDGAGNNGTSSNSGAASGALAKTGAAGMDATVIGAFLVLLLGAGVITGNRVVSRRRQS